MAKVQSGESIEDWIGGAPENLFPVLHRLRESIQELHIELEERVKRSLPLLTSWNTLNPGWTGESEMSSSSKSVNISSKAEKKFVLCLTCDKKLEVPSNYSGRIRCSHCDALMEV